MRKWLVALGGVVLLVTPTPAAATSYAAGPYFTYSTTAGPPGTTINVTGGCYPVDTSATVKVALATPVGSGASGQSVDSLTTKLDNGGKFTASITNKLSPTSDDPVDLEVAVTCEGMTRAMPFASTSRMSQASPSILSVPSRVACGFDLPEPHAPFDCSLPHLKGLNAAGEISLNEYPVNVGGRGASVAMGEFMTGEDGPEFAVASGDGNNKESTVMTRNVVDANSLRLMGPFAGWSGALNVAFADVSGDGRDELIVGAGPGGGPHVKVFTWTGEAWNEIASFFAFGSGFRGGVTVAGADVNGNGKAEIVVGAGPGGAPHVRIFNASGQPVGNGFYAYAQNFTGGVNVAGGNLTDAFGDEIVTGPGPGGGPHVRVFSGINPTGPGFYAYGPNLGGGVNVAVGNAEPGSALEIVTAPMSGGDPHVRVFTDTVGGFNSSGFYAYTRSPQGVKVAVARRF